MGCMNSSPVSTSTSPNPHSQPIAIALAGMLSLAVAMGIGRFAFTPLLPMMLHDGVVDLPGASWLATANYLGYWLGAMACALQPWLWSRMAPLRPVVHTTAMRLGLVLTVVLTLGMALHWPSAVATVAFSGRCCQCAGVCLHLGLVPGALGRGGCAAAGRRNFCRAGAGYYRQRTGRHRHGGRWRQCGHRMGVLWRCWPWC